MARLVVLVIFAAGCVVYDDSTHVVVRDPTAVTAAIQPDPEHAHSWVERSTGGAIDVWCADCRAIEHKLFTVDHELVVPGKPSDRVRLDGDRLAVDFTYDDRYTCGPPAGKRRRAPTCLEPAIAIELVTPRTNVESIRAEHRVSPSNGHHGAAQMFGFAAVWTAIAVTLGAFGVHDHDDLLIGAGLGALALGGISATVGVDYATAHDTITTTGL